MVELWTFNPSVMGSNPIVLTKIIQIDKNVAVINYRVQTFNCNILFIVMTIYFFVKQYSNTVRHDISFFFQKFLYLKYLSDKTTYYVKISRPYTDIYKIFDKLHKKVPHVDKTEYDRHVSNYIHFLNKNEYKNKVEEMEDTIFKNQHIMKDKILGDFNLNDNEICVLLSIFFFKSINRFSLNKSIKQINYRNSDNVLNEICQTYKDFHIFYLKKEFINEDLKFFRKSMFKYLEIFVLRKQVHAKKSYYKNKSLIYYSFNYENIELTGMDHLKISLKPFQFSAIGENYYLIGSFFTMTKKIFVENTASNFDFKINDITYVQNMCNSSIFLNLDDLSNVADIFKRKNLTIESIENLITTLNSDILRNLNFIHDKQKESKTLTHENIKKYVNAKTIEEGVKGFLFIKQFILNNFFEYSKKKINKGEDKLKNDNKGLFFSYMYVEFVKKFSNAYLKLEFENLQDFINWKHNTKEFGVSLTDILDKETSQGDENFNFHKKIKIKKKINPQEISFITYLIIYTKKETDELLNKFSIKIAENAFKIDINKIQEDVVEHAENENLSNYYFLLSFLLKFNTEGEKGIKLHTIWKDIQTATFENKKKYSQVSKMLHNYNVLLLEKFFENKHMGENKNIQVFFMFFFDFRGRFYHDSVISPTSNKFCRLVYNYGIVAKKDINFSPNVISLYIKKYYTKINEVRLLFGISEDSPFIYDSLFWIMISIGKIGADKSNKKISIDNFLETCLNLLKNDALKDDLDFAEFNYYVSIIKSLKDDKILKRCLIKDATASFFQNLVRILGENSETTLEMANLKSWDYWYDWYAYVLDEFLKNEKNNKNFVEENFKFFVRKTIKKVVMTVPYSASFMTCFEYFKESVFEIFEKDVAVNDEIGETFKRFYTFLKNQFKKNGPFRENPEKINAHFKKILKEGNHVIIITRNGDTTNLTYLKTVTRHFDFIIRYDNIKKRIIKNYKEIDQNSIDTKKTSQALNANLVHCVDALLVRDVNNAIFEQSRHYYISIHDSFMVNFLETSNFVLIANNEANKNIFKEEIWNQSKNYFSLFIFI